MSATAFKRDLADAKTIEDFVRQVQSPERLRLLLILTVVDIRAVGPGDVERLEASAAAHPVRSGRGAASARSQAAWPGRTGRASGRRAGRELGWKASAIRAHARRLPDSYWLAEPLDWQVANARQVAAAEARIGDAEPTVVAEDDPDTARRG